MTVDEYETIRLIDIEGGDLPINSSDILRKV